MTCSPVQATTLELVVKPFRIVASRWSVAPSIIGCAMLVAACSEDPIGPLPVPETAVAVTYCAAAAPSWVAFRDGDGAWTQQLADGSGARTTFRKVFTSTRAAMASLTPLLDGQLTVLRVLYGTPAEMSTEGDTTLVDCVVGSGKTLRGVVAGLDTTQLAAISVGLFGRASVRPRLGLEFSVNGVASGPQDLLATRTSDGSRPIRFIVRRDIDLPSDALIPTLDFESTEAFDAVTSNVSIENLGDDAAVNSTSLFTSHGRFALPLAPRNTPTQPYIALPSSKLVAGDVQELHISTNDSTTTRTADVYFQAPVDRTVRVGDRIDMPAISTIARDGSLRLRARFAPQADYDRLTSVVYEHPATGTFVVTSMTSAYAALAGGYELDVPDLSGAAGFDASWALNAAMRVNWNAFRVGGTLPIGRNAVPSNGATRRTTGTRGEIASP
jgi:hypothetical protein